MWRDEVVGDGREHPLQDIGRVTVALGLQVGLPEQAVGVEMARVGLEDVAGVGNGLVELFVLDEVIDLPDISAQARLSHRCRLTAPACRAGSAARPAGLRAKVCPTWRDCASIR